VSERQQKRAEGSSSGTSSGLIFVDPSISRHGGGYLNKVFLAKTFSIQTALGKSSKNKRTESVR